MMAYHTALTSAPRPTAPDGAGKRLHIRCGHDLHELLPWANLPGDYLAYTDPLPHGPVPALGDLRHFRTVRSAFIAHAYRLKPETVAHDLEQADARLLSAEEYDDITLWAEHDLYDQLFVLRVLDLLADQPKALGAVHLVAADDHPAVARFMGLGQLPPDHLPTLHAQRKAVTFGQVELARKAWAAFTAPTPDALTALLREDLSALPYLRRALLRHAYDYPDAQSGLGLTERLVLGAAREPIILAKIFQIWQDNDPLPTYGDTMLFAIVRSLANAKHPALRLSPAHAFAARATTVRLTEFGFDILYGRASWLAKNKPPRWLGGVAPEEIAAWRVVDGALNRVNGRAAPPLGTRSARRRPR